MDELTCLDNCPHTDQEYDTLPNIFLTSELLCDPIVFDCAFDKEVEWIEPDHHTDLHPNNLIDEFGNYCHRVGAYHLSYFTRQDDPLMDDQYVLQSHKSH